MTGLVRYLAMTLRLDLRSWQAWLMAIAVPLLFLLAFSAVNRGSLSGFTQHVPIAITIAIMGATLFSLPVSIAGDRERGVWRRLRVTPMPAIGFVAGTAAARLVVIVVSSALVVAVAICGWHVPLPLHPLQTAVALIVGALGFLGLGLGLAMLAHGAAGAQALAQAVFLPTIIIGGAGMPVWKLPEWGRHVSCFLPARYAVDVLRLAWMDDSGLARAWFDIGALLAMAAIGVVAAAKLFRWDGEEHLSRSQRGWAVACLVAWLLVGVAAEIVGLPARSY